MFVDDILNYDKSELIKILHYINGVIFDDIQYREGKTKILHITLLNEKVIVGIVTIKNELITGEFYGDYTVPGMWLSEDSFKEKIRTYNIKNILEHE